MPSSGRRPTAANSLHHWQRSCRDPARIRIAPEKKIKTSTAHMTLSTPVEKVKQGMNWVIEVVEFFRDDDHTFPDTDEYRPKDEKFSCRLSRPSTFPEQNFEDVEESRGLPFPEWFFRTPKLSKVLRESKPPPPRNPRALPFSWTGYTKPPAIRCHCHARCKSPFQRNKVVAQSPSSWGGDCFAPETIGPSLASSRRGPGTPTSRRIGVRGGGVELTQGWLPRVICRAHCTLQLRQRKKTPAREQTVERFGSFFLGSIVATSLGVQRRRPIKRWRSMARAKEGIRSRTSPVSNDPV